MASTPATSSTTVKSVIAGPSVQLGSATTDTIGFYGSTGVARRSGSAQAAITTASATATTPYGFATQAQADAIVTLANELRAALVALNVIKGGA